MSVGLRARVRVERAGIKQVDPFVKSWHYSGSTLGVTKDYCFLVLLDGAAVGGAIFGAPAGAGVLKKYSDNFTLKTTELRRFVLIDDTPRNTESCALGKLFNELRLLGVSRVLAYSDPKQGHTGCIYKATGFVLAGKTSARKHIRMPDGRLLPDRNLHQVNFPYHLQVRAAVADGSATFEHVPGKLAFIKDLLL